MQRDVPMAFQGIVLRESGACMQLTFTMYDLYGAIFAFIHSLRKCGGARPSNKTYSKKSYLNWWMNTVCMAFIFPRRITATKGYYVSIFIVHVFI